MIVIEGLVERERERDKREEKNYVTKGWGRYTKHKWVYGMDYEYEKVRCFKNGNLFLPILVEPMCLEGLKSYYLAAPNN